MEPQGYTPKPNQGHRADKALSVMEAMDGTGTDKGPGVHNYHRYYERWEVFHKSRGLRV